MPENSYIPFNKLCLSGNEMAYIQQAIEGGHTSGNGPFTKQCEALLEKELGVGRALLTSSCTHALELSALLLDIGPGDEVIVPSFTFVSTANAFALRGAKIVFADIRSDTLNINESLVEKHLSARTKAIIAVHYAGVACDMDALQKLASKHAIPLVEDNAHGLFAKYKGRYLGTFGHFSTQSFHETKNFTCGEGGALLINDKRYIERAEIIREKGTDRSRFLRGQVDKYTWVDLGSNYLMSDISAAFLYAQLESHSNTQEIRKKIWSLYYDDLQDWARINHVRLPVIPDECQQSYHLFYMLFPTQEKRDGFIEFLKGHNILSVFHYQPLHLSRMGKKSRSSCPVTEDITGRLVRLPLFNHLTRSEQRHIISLIKSFSMN